MPLYRLWGGFRDALPMIGIGGYYTDDPASLEEEVELLLRRGLRRDEVQDRGALARPRTPSAWPGRSKRPGPGSSSWSTPTRPGPWPRRWSSSTARAPFVELRWFEEPCQWPDDRRAMQVVRFKTGVPVAAGQMEITRSAMRDLMMDGAIDVSNFDASWGGGPTEWRRVAQMAMSFGVEMGHHEEAQVASHLLASVPHGTLRRGLPPGPGPDLLEDARQPPGARRRDVHPSRRPRASDGSSTRAFIREFRLTASEDFLMSLQHNTGQACRTARAVR